jgi:predicted O-methyltransferase YrrM
MSLVSENAVLRDLFDTGKVPDPNGTPLKVHSQICASFADALYETVLKHKPFLVLEVGMAFGVATLAILTALDKLSAGGRLISVDPNQSTHWKKGGITNVVRAGLQSHHELIEEPDYLALPRLLASGCRINLAYIDGWHTFDYTMIDLWYIDKMMQVNGVIGINDCGWPAVHKAINFFLTHRRYEEVNVGLKPIYSRKMELKRYLKGNFARSSRVLFQDRYFRKQEHWEPYYDFFADF